MRWIRHDLLYSLRSLTKSPGFAVTAIVTLALGIGANVAVFDVVQGVLLRPLPYPEPDRLVAVWAQWLNQDNPRVSHTGGDFQEYRREAKTFEGLAAVGSVRQNLTDAGEPAQVQVGWISRNFFSVLGVAPSSGRDFTAEEPSNSLLLSDAFWHRQLGGDPDVLGRAVRLDGKPFTVVGILPPGFRLYLAANAGISTDIDVWKPPDETGAPDRWSTSELKLSTLRVIGRLRPDVTLSDARAEMAEIAERLRDRYADHKSVGFHLAVEPLHDEIVGHVRRSLLTLQGAVLFLLLIACVNVVNLLLIRGRSRRREIAVRLSLGGRMGDVVRQRLSEALVLASLGGALGVLLAKWGVDLVKYLAPGNIPRLDSVGIEPPVLAFALGMTLLSALLSGLIPALGIRRWNVSDVLRREDARTGTGEVRLNKALTVTELALSLVLLLGTGLLLQSFLNLRSVRPGFDTNNLLTFSVSLPGTRYEAPRQTDAFLARLESRIDRLPQVRSAATVWPLPLEGQIWYGPYGIPDRPEDEEAQQLADYRLITPGYPATIGARLIEGRLLRPTDTDSILVDESFAQKNWPGRSPLGRTVEAVPEGPVERLTVVGVIENIRHESLGSNGRETLYLPTRRWSWADWELAVVVRCTGDPQAVVPPIRDALHELDPLLPMAKVRTMNAYVDDKLAPHRFLLGVMLVFAIVASILASVGLYGVISYSLSLRTREIGIHMALGARRSWIVSRVLREGIVLAGLGLALGLAAWYGFAGILRSLLYGVEIRDLATLTGIVCLLAVVAVAATFVPAVRAARLDPVATIREE